MSVRKPATAAAEPKPCFHGSLVYTCMNHLTQIRRLLDDVRMQDSPREAGDDILEILVHLRSVEIELQGIAEPPEPGTVAP